MKLESIFVITTLIVIVKGAWWATAVQPVILGFGAILTALNEDVIDIELPSMEKQEGERGWSPLFLRRAQKEILKKREPKIKGEKARDDHGYEL